MKIILLLLLCILWVWVILSPAEKEKLLPQRKAEKNNPLPLQQDKSKQPIEIKKRVLPPKIDTKILHQPLPRHIANAKIVVSKSQRQLSLYSGTRLLRRYPIALGFNPTADKRKEGDGATPEGEFYIFTKNPKSAYYLSLGISYPNNENAKRGLKSGLITRYQYQKIIQAQQRKIKPPQNTALGGLIYIHGRGSQRDWTYGCVALDDNNMKELFNVINVGTPVVITR